jgi:5'-nucleotidase (lipoprotein e(P4) family)
MNTTRFLPGALLAIIFLGFVSCEQPGNKNTPSPNERMLNATLYQQTSPEVDALSYQAYFIARVMLESELNRGQMAMPRAIITDVDETILDNSPYQAQCILEGISYPEKWDEWCKQVKARPLPGSQQFLNYAAAQGVEIFYVTNRKEHLKEATLLNLRKHAFPNADEEHLLMRTSTSSKEPRRKKIAEDYRIVLLLGDNIEDFTNVFEERGIAEKKELAEKLKESFGRRFIVFPNPMYGSWESAVYNYNYDTTETARASMRLEALTGF